MMSIKLALFVFLILSSFSSYCQYDDPLDFKYPSLSPKGEISQIVRNTQIAIQYERPSVRDRKIFGELIPWNQVWRTGAGHCTKVSFDKPVKIRTANIPAGKYSLLTIPNPQEWTIILNSDTSLYGTGKYDPNQDILRFKTKSNSTSRHYEALTIDIDIIPNNGRLYISWSNVQVAFDIQTSTDGETMDFIKRELVNEPLISWHLSSAPVKRQWAIQYALAAEYLFFQNDHLDMALELAETAFEIDSTRTWAIRLKMDVYERSSRYHEALKEVKRGINHARSRNYDKEFIDRDVQFWEEHRDRLRGKLNNTDRNQPNE